MTVDPRGLVEQLAVRGDTLATAESLTGGQLAALFTSVPGASACFLGGIVAYATAVKLSVLGVPAQVVETHGVISGECASAMANGARTLTGATYALATTGVAGPDPQEGHRPGRVWVACASPAGVEARVLALSGGRAEIQAAACQAAMSALEGILRREDTGLR